MLLEINKSNYYNYIKSIHLNKRYKLLVCIPTFKSFEITSKSIKSLYNQKDISFDLLVIGPSGDIELLVEKFPDINFCITKDNYGSSGNQLLNIYISKDFKYEYVVLTDNDAFFLDDFGLSKMLHILKRDNLVWVFPILNNIDLKTNKYYLGSTFHCSLFSSEIFLYLEYYFNPNYFLLFDDVSFSKRLEYVFPGRFKYVDVRYYHPRKLNVLSFDKKYSFFCTRSILIYLFRERFPLKFKLSSMYLRPVLSILLIFFLKYGFDYIKILAECLKQVYKNDYNLNYLNNLKNKIVFEEISEKKALKIEKIKPFKLINNLYQTIFVPEKFKYKDSDNKFKYFIRIY